MNIKQLFPKQNVNILFDYGGLGDHCATMPVMKYAQEEFSHITWYLWVPDYFLEFARNLLPNMIIRPFSKNNKYVQKWPSRRLSFGNVYTNLRSHMTEHAARILLNQELPLEAKNYLQLDVKRINIDKFELPEKYIIVTTGFTAPIREMPPEYINKVVDYIILKGYKPVFLGKRQSIVGYQNKSIIGYFKDEIHYDKGINLVDKTDLLEAGKIIAGAKCIVGLDNGLLHVAGCTKTPIIGSFTSVDPNHRMPYRNNIKGWEYYPVVPPDNNLEKFFQSRHDFLFTHDYKTSFLKTDSLIQSVTPELYIEQLEKILK